MNRLSLLLINGTQVGPFVQQQLHHLQDEIQKKNIGFLFWLGKSVKDKVVSGKLVAVSPPGSHFELHGVRQCGQCDLPCSGCSAGSAGPLHSAWPGWQQPREVASAKTCLVHLPRLHASAKDPLPSGEEDAIRALVNLQRAAVPSISAAFQNYNRTTQHICLKA